MYYRVAVQFPVSCMRDVLSSNRERKKERGRKFSFAVSHETQINAIIHEVSQRKQTPPEGEKYTGKNILGNYTRVSERDS